MASIPVLDVEVIYEAIIQDHPTKYPLNSEVESRNGQRFKVVGYVIPDNRLRLQPAP